jgi:hypothetical protein
VRIRISAFVGARICDKAIKLGHRREGTLVQVPYSGDYLLRLEQLLARRCASMGTTQRGLLNNEREIIEGNIGLCIDHPSDFPSPYGNIASLLKASNWPSSKPSLAVNFFARCQSAYSALLLRPFIIGVVLTNRRLGAQRTPEAS